MSSRTLDIAGYHRMSLDQRVKVNAYIRRVFGKPETDCSRLVWTAPFGECVGTFLVREGDRIIGEETITATELPSWD